MQIYILKKIRTYKLFMSYFHKSQNYRANIQKTLHSFGIDRAKIYPAHTVTAVTCHSDLLSELRKIDLAKVNTTNIALIINK